MAHNPYKAVRRAIAEGLVHAAHQLDLLLRHPLLLQAEVGERAVEVEVGDKLRDLTVADVEQVRSTNRSISATLGRAFSSRHASKRSGVPVASS
jgi:hypothetical protein